MNAGPDLTITLTDEADLHGEVSNDDGLPNPPKLTMTWTTDAGPGVVILDDENAADTTATFTEPGSYTLRLTAHDGALSASDEVTVTVKPETLEAPKLAAQLKPPAIPAGSRATITGTISPAAAKTPLRLQRWAGSTWGTVQQKTLAAGQTKSYSFTVKPGGSGVHRYRVVAPAHAGRDRAIAPSDDQGLRLRVYAAVIKRVKPNGDEFVLIRDTGKVGLNLKGWRLRDNANGRVVTLPARELASGGWVRVHTGNGNNGAHDVYLSKRPMWDKHGTALLRDGRGLLVDRHRY